MLAIQVNTQAHPAIFTGSLAKIINRVKIERDDDAELPREWDNLGTMYCEHRRYELGDKKAEDIRIEDEETGAKSWPKKGYTILPLFLYDHSGITMSTSGFSCNWDSGQVGYIYISDEKAKKEFGWKIITKNRRALLIKYLNGEVETYDQYLTGDVYGFTHETLAVYDDGSEEEVEDAHSCWGFFGSNWADNGIEDCLGMKLKDCEVTAP